MILVTRVIFFNIDYFKINFLNHSVVVLNFFLCIIYYIVLIFLISCILHEVVLCGNFVQIRVGAKVDLWAFIRFGGNSTKFVKVDVHSTKRVMCLEMMDRLMLWFSCLK